MVKIGKKINLNKINVTFKKLFRLKYFLYFKLNLN